MNIINSINKRWSPVGFSKEKLSIEKLNTVFEAARWAPSSMNEQPWNYYYSFKGEAGFERMLDCLVEANREWAKNAPVLILSVANKNFRYKNRPNRHAMHDTGAANSLLAIQAAELGLQAHQMGGFDADRTYKSFNLSPSEFEPATFIALGYPADPENLEEKFKQRDTQERKRKDLASFSKHFI
jgi:nitroreductase